MKFDAEEFLRSGLEWQDLHASDAQIKDCLVYIELLEKWNKVYNLTSIKNKKELIQLHLLDSLSIVPEIKSLTQNLNSTDNQSFRFVDVGTGAGLPGIPLAIFNPHYHFTLIDTRGKKVRFLRQVKNDLKLDNIEPLHTRVEAYDPKERYHFVITRAFSSIKDMLELTSHLCHTNGLFLAMKGRESDFNLEEVPHNITWQSTIKLSVYQLEAERCLVNFKKIAT